MQPFVFLFEEERIKAFLGLSNDDNWSEQSATNLGKCCILQTPEGLRSLINYLTPNVKGT